MTTITECVHECCHNLSQYGSKLKLAEIGRTFNGYFYALLYILFIVLRAFVVTVPNDAAIVCCVSY